MNLLKLEYLGKCFKWLYISSLKPVHWSQAQDCINKLEYPDEHYSKVFMFH